MFDDDLDGLQLKRWFLLAKGRDLKFTIETWESNADPGTSSQKRQLVFTLSNDGTLNGTGSKLWNHIELVVNRNGFIWLSSNGVTVQGRYNARFDHFGGGTGGRDVHFGSLDPFSPFIGCLQNIELNEVGVDPMALMAASATSSSDMFGRSYTIVGNVTLDNCASLSPCSNMAQVCEHGGRCVPKMDGTYFCDCSHTGYVGRTCHFCKFPVEFKNFDLFIFDFFVAVYRKSCEEIYLMDKQHSGIYMIDVDRNGPMPPSHVMCELLINDSGQDGNNVTLRTVVEHNIQHQVVSRCSVFT